MLFDCNTMIHSVLYLKPNKLNGIRRVIVKSGFKFKVVEEEHSDKTMQPQ